MLLNLELTMLRLKLTPHSQAELAAGNRPNLRLVQTLKI